MSLPYVRDVKYISPSSLDQFERNPVKFYLDRLGPKEFKPAKPPQAFYFAVGSAFDSYVKDGLRDILNIDCAPLKDLLAKEVSKDAVDREDAIKLGAKMFNYYERCGALEDLIKEGLDRVDIPVTDPVPVPGTTTKMMGRTVGGIPIKGKPDATIGRPVLDWKTTGSGSGASPNPGYTKIYDMDKPFQPPHARRKESMEELNATWAKQLVMYHWMLYPDAPFEDVPVAIDQVVISAKGTIRVAKYRSVVTKAFQQDLRVRLQYMWERIQQQRVVEDEDLIDMGPEMLSCLI